MSKTHSFGLSVSTITIVAVVLLASAAPAAELKIPQPAPLARCVLPDPDAPLGATVRCRDGTYGFGQHRRATCSHHLGVAESLTRRADGKCASDVAP
ncbi:MAG: DUF3761 domain-containing protein [Xanthobacteraceae bacterium]